MFFTRTSYGFTKRKTQVGGTKGPCNHCALCCCNEGCKSMVPVVSQWPVDMPCMWRQCARNVFFFPTKPCWVQKFSCQTYFKRMCCHRKMHFPPPNFQNVATGLGSHIHPKFKISLSNKTWHVQNTASEWRFRDMQGPAFSPHSKVFFQEVDNASRCLEQVRWELLQNLRWRCMECVIHHERDVGEEQQYCIYKRGANKQQ